MGSSPVSVRVVIRGPLSDCMYGVDVRSFRGSRAGQSRHFKLTGTVGLRLLALTLTLTRSDPDIYSTWVLSEFGPFSDYLMCINPPLETRVNPNLTHPCPSFDLCCMVVNRTPPPRNEDVRSAVRTINKRLGARPLLEHRHAVAPDRGGLTRQRGHRSCRWYSCTTGRRSTARWWPWSPC